MTNWTKSIRNCFCKIRSLAIKKVFLCVERCFHIHITPVHYSSPIPNVRELRPGIFTKVNECVGLSLSADKQFSNLEPIFLKYLNEYTPPVNGGLSQVDSFVLYSMIRYKKPSLIVEIGSGESTKISLDALEKNVKEGAICQFKAIEPFPKQFLREIRNETFQLIGKKVQDLDTEFLSQADILFIDSSHVAKIGSDVCYEILDIVPRLKAGTLVHWHDIMLPIDYPEGWIKSGNQFWNESYMVHAFMLYNTSFEVIWASKYMQLNFAKKLRETFPYFRPEDPNQQLSSFWIERVS